MLCKLRAAIAITKANVLYSVNAISLELSPTEKSLSMQVFLAVHEREDRHVALKVIATDGCRLALGQLQQPIPDKLADFMLECSILDSLLHPNIISSYESFMATNGGQQCACLVTEVAAGKPSCNVSI